MFDDSVGISDELSINVGSTVQDGIGMSGNIKIEHFDKDMVLKELDGVNNLTTTLGFQMSADQLLETPTVAKAGWMEVGTGTGQDANDSILAAYIAGSRTALTSKTRGANAIVTHVCTLGPGVGTGAVTEVGLFNVATENTTDMIAYSSFAVKNKGALDTIVFTWTSTTSIAA